MNNTKPVSSMDKFPTTITVDLSYMNLVMLELDLRNSEAPWKQELYKAIRVATDNSPYTKGLEIPV